MTFLRRRSLPTLFALGALAASAVISGHSHASSEGLGPLTLTNVRSPGSTYGKRSLRMPSRDEWRRLVEREQAEARRSELFAQIRAKHTRSPGPPKLTAGLDVVHRTMDLDVDPSTAQVSGTVELRVTTFGGQVSSFGVSLAPGVSISKVEQDGTAGTVVPHTEQGFTYFEASLPSAISAGKESAVRLTLQGTASCTGKDAPCTLQSGFARFTTGSIVPYVFDLENPPPGFDGATTDLTLRVPQGLDAVVSADPAGKRTENGKSVTVWKVPNEVNHAYGFYVFVGNIGRQSIPGRSVPTELISPKDGSAADPKIASWSKGALDFVEGMMGEKLPFANQSLVRLPRSMDDVGTVSYGMTLLNETYGSAGDEIYHETWVHENAHLAWAITVPEPEAYRTRILTEGLATLTEVDFTKSLFPEEDRDHYLARRYQAIRLDWVDKGTLEKLPPVVATQAAAQKVMAGDYQRYAGWAYEKSAATLDLLRVIVGDEAFASAMKDYVKTYAWKGASIDEFRALLEKASGVDLAPVFDRWVTKTSRPELRIGFRKAASGGYEATIDKDDEGDLPLPLTVIDMNGVRKVVRGVAKGTSSTIPIPLEPNTEVYAVVPNPRLGVLSKTLSPVTGDVDFDGQADGKDLLACAKAVGTRFEKGGADGTLGLWNLASDFAVQCDLDEDGDVDETDWNAIVSAFGANP